MYIIEDNIEILYNLGWTLDHLNFIYNLEYEMGLYETILKPNKETLN